MDCKNKIKQLESELICMIDNLPKDKDSIEYKIAYKNYKNKEIDIKLLKRKQELLKG